jgi:DNA polymerase Ligase (LigD)
MPRYVVLRHELPAASGRGVHWDLMLESEGVLRTWALDQEPAMAGVTTARQLADHRLAYLTYEGEISGERGSVTRWDAGEYSMRKTSPDHLSVRLRGGRLECVVSLQRQADGHCWSVSFAAEPTSG